MVKKKQNTPNRQTMTVLKKFWWAVLLFLVIAGVFVYIAASNYLIQLRFESTYMQLKDVSVSFSGDSSQTTLTKSCKTNYYGFNSVIECRVSLGITFNENQVSDLPDTLKGALEQASFRNIDIGSADGMDERRGTAVFMSKNQMACAGYWESNAITKVKFYCHEQVRYFLPGYERE